MATKLYTFREHNLIISGEKDDLICLAELLRDAEGTIGDLRYQIEREFDIDGVRSVNEEVTYSIYKYDDEGTIMTCSVFDDYELDTAIEIAKKYDYDEVVNDITDEVVWRKQ